ncbi:Metallo-dependent phosphatase-like protein [Chaetomidium leptoderma]|uniref:Metallo-dependent phosphatase-like protein n=1 Tax=Chaetomidium leptoderma TaxID=669021 RepID=A0AAN6VF82_9PEZI|nr:Metallo-dependent phosphatase-like protein [Chaetomidium leptoderma]
MEALLSKVLSDLHLEVGQQYSTFSFPASAPFLLLGGDIGRLIDYAAYRGFLESQIARYRKVFLVLGNHEFYGLDYQSRLDAARRLSEEPSLASELILLHRARWDDPDSDLTILGCTLWSDIPEESYGIVQAKVNDFKKIDQWTAQRHTAIHKEEVTWLREQVAQIEAGPAKRRILIATHHAPCVEGSARPEQVSNPWTPAFATDLVDKEGWVGVKTWVFGHTHYSAQLFRNGIRLLSNQRGYVLPGSAALKEDSTKRKQGRDFDAALAITA